MGNAHYARLDGLLIGRDLHKGFSQMGYDPRQD